MVSIAHAVAQLHAAALPVLFLDTCSLVDVIRAPMRPKQLKHCVQVAVELRQLISVAPIRCRLVAASFVRGEWQSHAEAERQNLQKHLADMDEFAAGFHATCSHLGMSPTIGTPDFSNSGLPDSLFNLSQQLLGSAIHLDAQDDTNMRAFGRAIKCTPPSKKGGEVKDCTITEECLGVCRQLRAAGFAQRLVFCSSNTDDYCDGKNLHPTIAIDFVPVGLAFAKTLPWAIHELLR